MTRKEILEKTMQQMPSMFTSNYFTKIAYENGYPIQGKNCGLGDFIELHATNEYKHSKTWHKNKDLNKVEKLELNDESCIRFLKSKGYKILKPINQFEEV